MLLTSTQVDDDWSGGRVGLLLETDGTGQLVAPVVRDCIFQGADPNVRVQGYVTRAVFDGLYCETSRGAANVELRARRLAGKIRFPSAHWQGVCSLFGCADAIQQRDAAANHFFGALLCRGARLRFRTRADGEGRRRAAGRRVAPGRPRLDARRCVGERHHVRRGAAGIAGAGACGKKGRSRCERFWSESVRRKPRARSMS